ARPGDPDPRRPRPHRRHPAGLVVSPRAGCAHLRRAGRGPPGLARPTPARRARAPSAPLQRMSALDQPRAVRAGEELDPQALRTLFARHAPEVQGPVTVQQFPRGYSNLTYLVAVGDRQLVLRRPPRRAQQIKAGHDMERESAVVPRRGTVWPKVPRTLFHVSEADSPLGVELYVMERVPGIILRGTRVPDELRLDGPAFRQLSETFVDTLVELHAIDPVAA